MSLSGALSNALSGLTASARGASVISSNLSNIMTEGYGVRSLSLSARSAGSTGGVNVNGVLRRENPALLAERRMADAEHAEASVQGRYMERLNILIGDPTKPNSLTARLAEFEADLISVANMPESETRLKEVMLSAGALCTSLNKISSGVQELRAEADRSIDKHVGRLNTMLRDIETLNRDIIAAGSQGNETASLIDQRQALIDGVAEIIPVKELPRELGSVALMTPKGVVLLDGHAAEITFEARHSVTVGMSVENGLLSGVQVNGSDIRESGGELGGLFSLRDDILPELQSQADAVALDLVQRFGSGLDPTLNNNQPGLFTDAGGSVDNVDGLSGRIKLHVMVDSDQGGSVWRLRAGIEALDPGFVGDATLLRSMIDALQTGNTPGVDHLGSHARDAATYFSDFMSSVALRTDNVEQRLSFTATRQSELTGMEYAQGVDSDAELQKLLLVEQVYAANAKLIQAIDEMLKQLMEIA